MNFNIFKKFFSFSRSSFSSLASEENTKIEEKKNNSEEVACKSPFIVPLKIDPNAFEEHASAFDEKIDVCKEHADPKKYFDLFAKHLKKFENDGLGKKIALIDLSNVIVDKMIIDLNPKAEYVLIDNFLDYQLLTALMPETNISLICTDDDGILEHLEELQKLNIDMKFDCIIMNPPYHKNLHLKILAEAIKHLKDDDSICVNLSPILWLEDPHAHLKAKSNLFKFDTNIVHKCEQLDVVDKNTVNQLFNIGLFANLGIYVCKNNAKGIDSKNFWKRNFEDWEVELFDKVYALNAHVEDKCENNKRDGIRVPIAFIAGNRGTLPIYKDLAYVVDGMKNGKDWTKCKNNGGYKKEEGIPIPISIKFATETEAQNFYDSWKTTFCKWLSKRFLFDQNINLRFLPFFGGVVNPRTGLKGYESEWTDDDFYKYFNLTDDEIKLIEDTIKE